MITTQVRKVLAKYIEDPDQGSSVKKDWMEYVEDKSKSPLPPSKSLNSLFKSVDPNRGPVDIPEADEFGDENVTYNPYDYKDPSTKPKNLGDGVPFENKFPPHADLFHVTRPSIFKENGPLHWWDKSRREDWTRDPTEQRPAISLDRKYAVDGSAVERVMTAYLRSDIPTIGNVQVKTAASMLEVDSMMRAGDPEMYRKTVQRANALGSVTWTNQGNQDQIKRGLYYFSVPGSSGDNRTISVQFLRTQKQAPRGFLDFDMEMSCTCESFLFFGAQYYAVQGKYMYMPGFRPALLPPHPRTQVTSITRGPESTRKNMGKGLNFRMCKHIMKVVDYIRDNFKVDETVTYKNYPRVGRPSFVVNAEKWEEAFKFPFTPEEIKKQLTSGLKEKPPFYYSVYTREKGHYDQVDEWVDTVFEKLPPSQRIAYLRLLAEHPEEIFYILWRHALNNDGKIDPILINTGYRLMDKTIKSKSEQEPGKVPGLEQPKDEKAYQGPNMTGVVQPSEIEDSESEDDEGEEETRPGEKEEPEKKTQPLKGKRIAPEVKERLKKEKQEARGVRKTDIRNDI
jgi:hypothetical protein